MNDPGGLYSRLGVDPAATPEAIAAAFRRRARVLHPDVPGTGDAAAFIRVKEAYDVLSDADRRARYDRSARATSDSAPRPQPMPSTPRIRPRLSDLPLPLWLGLSAVFSIAAVMAVLQLRQPPSLPPNADVRPFAPSVPASRPAAPAKTVAPADGPSSHYILPAGGDAVLWQRDASRDSLVPVGRLAAFSPVQAVRLESQHGLVEIRLADGGTAFIDAARVTSGDRVAARRAHCAYDAGTPPANGEMLARHGQGQARLELTNRGTQSAVVKLRDASGQSAATVFMAAGGRAVVADLPDIAYRPEFATGELWSRACGAFTAGMRAQQFITFALPSGLSPLVVPPDLSVEPAAVDIPDKVFEREGN